MPQIFDDNPNNSRKELLCKMAISGTPPPSKRYTFTDFPAEFRNQIYQLILIAERPIIISFPPRGSRYRKTKLSLSHWVKYVEFYKLCLNRTLCEEVSSFFFGSNTFVVGNHDFRSSRHPNTQGLIKFIQRMSRAHLAYITNVTFVITFSKRQHDKLNEGSMWDSVWSVGRKEDLKDLKDNCDMLCESFPNLKLIKVQDRIRNTVCGNFATPRTSMLNLTMVMRRLIHHSNNPELEFKYTIFWDSPNHGTTTQLKEAVARAYWEEAEGNKSAITISRKRNIRETVERQGL